MSNLRNFGIRFVLWYMYHVPQGACSMKFKAGGLGGLSCVQSMACSFIASQNNANVRLSGIRIPNFGSIYSGLDMFTIREMSNSYQRALGSAENCRPTNLSAAR